MYIDPGLGSYANQAIVAGLLGLVVGFRERVKQAFQAVRQSITSRFRSR